MLIIEFLKTVWSWFFYEKREHDTSTDSHNKRPKSENLCFRTFLNRPEVEEVIATDCQPLWRINIWNRQVFFSGDDKCIKRIDQTLQTCKYEVASLSGNSPDDFAIEKSGEIVYADWQERTVCRLTNGAVESIINIGAWKPWALCCTVAGDILVAMRSRDMKHARVVGYKGSQKTREYRFDNNGHPLYASPIFIVENNNQDVCVSDADYNRVTVVDQNGRFKFHYNGRQVSTLYPTFYPKGLATDSQCNILVADQQNNCIHILDRVGQLVSFIADSSLDEPYCLCVGSEDELFVGEYHQGKIKKLKYLQ